MSGDRHRPEHDDALRWIRRDREIEPTPPHRPGDRERDITIRPDREIEPTPPGPAPQRGPHRAPTGEP